MDVHGITVIANIAELDCGLPCICFSKVISCMWNRELNGIGIASFI